MAKILFNHCTPVPDKLTGLTVYTWKILEALARHGKHRYVLCTNWSQEKLPDFVRELDLEVVAVRNFKNESLAITLNTLRLPFLKRKHGCEAIFHPQPSAVVNRTTDSVTVVHDLYRITHPQYFNALQKLQFRWFMARGFVKAGRVIAVSHSTADALTDHYPQLAGRISVVHEASPISYPDFDVLEPPVSKPYALMVANLAPTKNVDLLVDAMRLLADRGEFPQVILVGRGSSSKLDQLSDDPRIKLQRLFSVSDAELQSLYFHAQCYLNTSIVEGFCLPILEAHTMGIPVICSDLPVLREVTGGHALFVDAHRADTLADAIEKIFQNKELVADLRSRSHENARRFSWVRAAHETESVIDEVLL